MNEPRDFQDFGQCRTGQGGGSVGVEIEGPAESQSGVRISDRATLRPRQIPEPANRPDPLPVEQDHKPENPGGNFTHGLTGPAWCTFIVAGKKAHVRVCNEIGVFPPKPVDIIDATKDCESIFITIDSPGGDTQGALALYAAFRAKDTEVLIDGLCASAAIPILLSGRRRRMTRDSTIMVHAAKSIVYGTSEDLESTAKRLRELTNHALHRILVQHTGCSCETADTWLSKDTYFDAEQALEFGFIDEIVEPQQASPVDCEAEPAAGLPHVPVKTVDELAFWELLQALGPLTVGSKERLARDLQAWLHYQIAEEAK